MATVLMNQVQIGWPGTADPIALHEDGVARVTPASMKVKWTRSFRVLLATDWELGNTRHYGTASDSATRRALDALESGANRRGSAVPSAASDRFG